MRSGWLLRAYPSRIDSKKRDKLFRNNTCTARLFFSSLLGVRKYNNKHRLANRSNLHGDEKNYCKPLQKQKHIPIQRQLYLRLRTNKEYIAKGGGEGVDNYVLLILCCLFFGLWAERC
mmetsp:Transcript_10751/g.10882  ORF Transcript_10751/g.10882 Transcript_10751/m.10882 type:complete len:118 (-) Transcript_10751:250-603(-)